MAGIDDKLVSGRSKPEPSEDEKAARSVVVSNIPSTIGKEGVMIYFQKKKFGGGEVDSVSMIEEGKAVIVFEKPEVAERVINGRHILRGNELELAPHCPGWDENLEVFSYVTARVNFSGFLLSSQESLNLIEKVTSEAGIEWREEADGFILSGMFDQVKDAHKHLQEYFSRRPYLQSRHEREEKRKDARKTQRNAPEPSKQPDIDVKVMAICEFEVQPVFMKLLKRVYRKKIQEIEEEFSLKIVWDGNACKVEMHPKTKEKTLYKRGCDAFISLYQGVCQNIKREVVEIKNVNDEEVTAHIQNAIKFVEDQNQVVIEKSEKQLHVFAEEQHMNSSVQALRQQLGLVRSNNQDTPQGQDAYNLNEKSSQGRPSLPNILSLTLKNGVFLSLYQGDITDEKVDAIVNATNIYLQHGEAGVAAAIVRKGGAQIVEDSWVLMQQRQKAPLQVGDAVYTRSGNLDCQCVIHTVGPEWSMNNQEKSISLLRKACVQSLRVAGQLGLNSVALPAVSSGAFGMPKDICAQTIFNAVEEYSSSVDAECSNLRDVRIVIIDGQTIEIFREEFVKRYCSNEMPETQRTHHVPSTTNSIRDRQVAKHQLPSGRNNQGEIVDRKSSCAEMDKSRGNGDEHVQLPNDGDRTSSLSSSIGKTPTEERVKDNMQKKENPVTDKYGKTASSSGFKTTRGRGFAPTFSQKGNGNSARSLIAGRGMTSSRLKKPPDATAENSGRTLEIEPVKPENHDQYADAADSVTSKPEDNPKGDALKNANHLEAGRKDDGASGDIPREKPIDETAKIENSSLALPLSKDEADDTTQADKKRDSPDSLAGPSSTSVERNALFKTEETNIQTSATDKTPTEGPAADGGKTSPSPPALTQDVNQTPPQKITEEPDPGSAQTESSTSDATTDPSQFSDITQSRDQSVQSRCSICGNTFRDPVDPSKCGHTFCKLCVDKAVADRSAVFMCNQEWCACERNQPMGTMSWRAEKKSLPGYENCGTIAITYNFAAGQQGWEHPRPGQPYGKLYFTAYLPNNSEGQAVCDFLKKAFDARLLFTVGRSHATGEENQILWNGVEHKTNRLGGPSNYGYPDPDYLDRVRIQLTKKGIVDEVTTI